MKRARQEPVSCQFCRVKKLRCDRQSPCSNCVTRGVECLQARPHARASITPTTSSPSTHAPPSDTLSLQSLHARIQRIENVLSIRPTGPSPSATVYTESNMTFRSQFTPPEHELRSDDGPEKNRIEFEKEGSTPRVLRSGSRFWPEIDASQLLQVWPISPEAYLSSSQWCDLLPPYERAVQLLDLYAHHVCWNYHFIHVPTLRRHLQRAYEQLEHGVLPEHSILALLCTVIALAKYFAQKSWALGENAASPDEQTYGDFVALASRALAQARHLDNPSLESIQAVILLASHLLLNTGATTAFRVLLTAMFMSAQALLIHQIDSPKNQKLRENTNYDRVELEMKRRLWWHIASSDWIFAFISDAQTETYVVHSNRMHVNLPSNTDDAALTPSHCVDEPLSVPTDMTYFLFRCRLSIIFREFMDAAAAQGLALDEVPYDDILAFDRTINAFIDSLPYFLKMDPESRQRCAELDLDKQRPYLVWQRLMAQVGACTRMSGLHRPYIARGARDPKYAYSRMVCLRSARTVLEFEKIIREEMHTNAGVMLDPRKIWAMMYQVFFATVVLVMDYHYNKDEPRAEERKQEIMDCCRRLEAAKDVSSIAARGLEELKRVMRRWGLLADTDSRGDGYAEEHAVPLWTAASSKEIRLGGSSREGNIPQMAGEEVVTASWMDAWDFNVELDDTQWAAVFLDLETGSGMF